MLFQGANELFSGDLVKSYNLLWCKILSSNANRIAQVHCNRFSPSKSHKVESLWHRAIRYKRTSVVHCCAASDTEKFRIDSPVVLCSLSLPFISPCSCSSWDDIWLPDGNFLPLLTAWPVRSVWKARKVGLIPFLVPLMSILSSPWTVQGQTILIPLLTSKAEDNKHKSTI